MTPTEFQRLKGFSYASRHKPTQAKRVTSRRSSKAKANATGQVLKSSRIVGQRIKWIGYK